MVLRKHHTSIISYSNGVAFFKICNYKQKNKLIIGEGHLTNKNKEKKAIISLLFFGFVVGILIIYLVITLLM